MFFANKIVSIADTDRVLEVGPGNAPFHRSDVLLEKDFDEEEAREQRGRTSELETSKPTIFYTGDRFPFEDNEFDYVICSHVLEHIKEEDMPGFVSELQRVAKKGYVEFPTICYEYLYNFKVHKTFLLERDGKVFYIAKGRTELQAFFPIQKIMYHSLHLGYDELIRHNRELFIQGFEWFDTITIEKTNDIADVVPHNIELTPAPPRPKKKTPFLIRLKNQLLCLIRN